MKCNSHSPIRNPQSALLCRNYVALSLSVCALLFAGCGKSSSGNASGKLSFLAPWARPQYQPGGSNALVYFVMYGRFQAGAEVPAKTYRTAGFPQLVELKYIVRTNQEDLPFVSDLLTNTVGRSNPALFAAIRNSRECLMFHGEVPDPHDFNYLRDLTGLIMFSLDHGAVAVLDVAQLRVYDPAAWRREVFAPQPPQFGQQVTMLVTDEPGGTRWFHTRGMSKFGRPDLSFRNVSQTNETAVTDIFKHYTLLQALGGVLTNGQQIQHEGLPMGVTCRYAGKPDDPEFNNVHVEFGWPEVKSANSAN